MRNHPRPILTTVPVEELLNSIRERFVNGDLTTEDLDWLCSQSVEAATMRQAIESWHEEWDNTYDGEPLKDYEIQMLKILGKQ